MNPTLVDPRDYKIGPDSLPQPGVPKGRLIKFEFNESRIFPGTRREGWIYVPRQYRRSQPAAVMITQDGAHHMTMARPWRLPVVFDNLIHKKEIPVAIGIFLEPGKVPAEKTGAGPRVNRSFEYDTLGDRYARFLIEEILPLVGKRYRLTDDPNGRMLLGGSSGALCSFNAAWERPDAFRRVFSCVGSYVNLRGGNIFPSLVRLSEPRPLRVFLQSGTADLDVFGGNWWAGNLDQLAALNYAGYEVNHAWGQGGHDDHHGSSIFVEALRWLWVGYPKEIRSGGGGKKPRQSLMRVLIKGKPWKAFGRGGHTIGKITVTPRGTVYGLEAGGQRLVAVSATGKTKVVRALNFPATDLCATRGEQVLLCQPQARRLLMIHPSGRERVIAERIDAQTACVDATGEIYAADAVERSIWHLARNGKRTLALSGVKVTDGLVLNDEETAVIGLSRGQRSAWIFQRKKDGRLEGEAPYIHLFHGPCATTAGATQAAAGKQGTVFLATDSGLQLANRDGAIAGLVDNVGKSVPSGVAIGGRNSNELYAVYGGRVYRRPINPMGEPGF